MKINDIVEIQDKEYFDEQLKTPHLLSVIADTIRDMRKYAGKTARITAIEEDGFLLDIDDGKFIWNEFEITKIEDLYGFEQAKKIIEEE
jgi:hypothetical protein